MLRTIAAATFLLVALAAAPPLQAAPASVSHYEHDVLQAEKRLIKHRSAKTKAFLRRRQAKANRLYRQQHPR